MTYFVDEDEGTRRWPWFVGTALVLQVAAFYVFRDDYPGETASCVIGATLLQAWVPAVVMIVVTRRAHGFKVWHGVLTAALISLLFYAVSGAIHQFADLDNLADTEGRSMRVPGSVGEWSELTSADVTANNRTDEKGVEAEIDADAMAGKLGCGPAERGSEELFVCVWVDGSAVGVVAVPRRAVDGTTGAAELTRAFREAATTQP